MGADGGCPGSAQLLRPLGVVHGHLWVFTGPFRPFSFCFAQGAQVTPDELMGSRPKCWAQIGKENKICHSHDQE